VYQAAESIVGNAAISIPDLVKSAIRNLGDTPPQMHAGSWTALVSNSATVGVAQAWLPESVVLGAGSDPPHPNIPKKERPCIPWPLAPALPASPPPSGSAVNSDRTVRAGSSSMDWLPNSAQLMASDIEIPLGQANERHVTGDRAGSSVTYGAHLATTLQSVVLRNSFVRTTDAEVILCRRGRCSAPR